MPTAAALQALLDAGWSNTAIVTLSQLIAFLAFQVRATAGLRTLGASLGHHTDATARASEETAIMSEFNRRSGHENLPVVFTQDQLGWLPWLEPLPEAEFTERHWPAWSIDPAQSRITSASWYAIPRPSRPGPRRTRTSSTTPRTACCAPSANSRLPRRPLQWLHYCASVHARFATVHSKRGDDVQRLLDEGIGADLGARWNAIVRASVALASTPIAFGPQHVENCAASVSMTPKSSM